MQSYSLNTALSQSGQWAPNNFSSGYKISGSFFEIIKKRKIFSIVFSFSISVGELTMNVIKN